MRDEIQKQISLGTLALPGTMEEVARRAQQAGYEGLEISGRKQMPLDQYPTRESREAVMVLLQELGLGVAGYNPDLSTTLPLQKEHRQAYLEQLQKAVQMCV